MGMKRRITAERKVISRVDPSLNVCSMSDVAAYSKSLNLDDLGKLPGYYDSPTYFHILPLKARWSSLDRGNENTSDDLWAIFSTHVTRIEGVDFEIEFDGSGEHKHIKDECREFIPDDFMRDIAQMIIQLANGEGTHVPFGVRDGLSAIIRGNRAMARPQRPPAKEAEEAAPHSGEDVKDSDSATP
jgi:hypothetical protein